MALHFAATQGATDIVRLMISSYTGSSDIVNAVDGNQETLLHRSVTYMLSIHCQKKIRHYGSKGSMVESFFSNDQKVKEFFKRPIGNTFAVIKR